MHRVSAALLVALTLLFAACVDDGVSSQQPMAEGDVRAPELVGLNNWINSKPLSLAQLRGKVVLVKFWTRTCANCLRTLPHVNGWYERYGHEGLVVVGVHTPETDAERNVESVRAAVEQFGIEFPVAQDNDYATWNAYSNRFWPALYLIDRSGAIVYRHFGEGEYEETEHAIQAALTSEPTQ